MNRTLTLLAYALWIIQISTADYYDDYKSGENINVSITSVLSCRASHACIGSQLVTTDQLWLSGAFCGRDSTMTSSRDFYAYSAYSAYSSDITSDLEMECDGHSSCMDSNATAPLVKAYGPLSAINTTIQSSGNMTVQFFGYKSGQNAKINCQNGDVCEVECFGTSACKNMECIGAGCSVVYTYNSSHPQSLVEYDAFDLLTSREAECNLNGALTFDNENENQFYNGTINSSSIVCFRGKDSCRLCDGIEASDNSVNCAGFRSCNVEKNKNTIADEVLCSGRESCADANITASNIYCLGKKSCLVATINMEPNGFLDCASHVSCRDANIESPGNNATVNIQFSGYYSFHSTNIVCKESDICNIVFQAMTYFASSNLGSITCNGQCNIECPQEFDCPSFVCCAYPRTLYVFVLMQQATLFLEYPRQPVDLLLPRQSMTAKIQYLNHLKRRMIHCFLS